MVIFQLLQNGVVIARSPFADGAVISDDGSSATWTNQDGSAGRFAAPGLTLMNQPDAGIGWMISGGVLVAPAPAVSSIPALRAHAFGRLAALRAALRTYALPGDLSVICDATPATGIDLQGLLVWGTANNSATTNWVDDNGGVVTLTGAQCSALALAVIAYGQSVFATLAQAMNGIANATITSTGQIDALAWPV